MFNCNSQFSIEGKKISLSSPTYFIADVAANHNGDLSKAKELIWLAKDAGADVAKFQHFLADKIVSDVGFKALGKQLGHQSTWKKSVYEIYKEAECNRTWTEELVKTAKEANITFMTAPYDYDAISMIDPYVDAYKIGSGDITWLEIISFIAKKNKPIILATGAATIEDVDLAVEAVLRYNPNLALLQCNTNYTGSHDNFSFVNLRVLQTFAARYPGIIVGLSDHTPGHAAVLGAIALGARVIEKHFTDNNNQDGPDHKFSLNPTTWREMIARSRELEAALGDGIKRVESNEDLTVVLQRRCIRLKHAVSQGHILAENDLEMLRPAPHGAYTPAMVSDVIGKIVLKDKAFGDALYPEDLVSQQTSATTAKLSNY